ncbi:MAG TPA: serine/threonine-protein kinase [Lacipirellulaceae bacterium]
MATVETSRPTTRIAASATSAADCHKVVGRLGPWQLVRLLAEGNLTRVYQARPAESPTSQPADGESPLRPAAYAVKLLRNEWWRDSAAIEMQRREAWVGARVSHPNLLPVLSASVQQPPFYLVTPKLDGTDLAQIVIGQGRLGIPLALWIARQIADGLAALYEATSMIHADVKPANVLVSPTGHATLIDFGFVQTPAEARNWTTRPVAGTLAYIAPEMVTSALAADQRCDIYSLGVTLYEMLVGRRPFDSDDPGTLATHQRESKPADVRTHRPDVPEPVAALLSAMLAKDPLRRPDSARALASRLVRLEIDNFTLR